MARKKRPSLMAVKIRAEDRKRIRSDETVPLELNDHERELILKHTFAPDELAERLRIGPQSGEPPLYHFTLDDLDELGGFIAAEANHANDKGLQKVLQQLFVRIQELLESYTDQDN